ncbi:MAG: putative C-S lyase [Bacteroidetes bacterium]|nr:MAG: putative C-S lyase [Bacteroidota bacterium]
MEYNFDRRVDRRGTDCIKYDLTGTYFGSREILPMWVADMDFEVPDFIREAILERAAHPVYGYTFRPPRFYESVAGWLSRRHGWEVSAGSISFSPGVVPAFNLCVMAMTEPGDRILVQPPVYFPFFTAVTGHDRILVNNQLLESRGKYTMDLDHLEEEFRKGVRMFLFCHPHNPVGRAWTKDELERLAELCIRYDVLVISDEIHSDLNLFSRRHIPLASLGKEIAWRTVTCVAPSKTFNLAGLYSSAVIITDPGLKKTFEKILDAIHIGGGNIFGMVAMEAAYTHGDAWVDQLLRYLGENYLFLSRLIEKEIPGIIISPLEATYLAWLDMSFLGMDDEQLKTFLIRTARLGFNHGPMFGPGGEQHQRMNIGVPREVLAEGLGRLKEAVGSLQ